MGKEEEECKRTRWKRETWGRGGGLTSSGIIPHFTLLHLGVVHPLQDDRLVGLVVKASTSRAEDPGFDSCLRRDFFGVESYQ